MWERSFSGRRWHGKGHRARAVMTSWEAVRHPGFGRGGLGAGLASSPHTLLGARTLLGCLQISCIFSCAAYITVTLGHLKSHLKYKQPQ